MLALTLVAHAEDVKPSPTPVPQKAKKLEDNVSLANILGLTDDLLAQVDPAAMYYLAGEGLTSKGKPITVKDGMAVIDQIAFVYGESGLDANPHGKPDDERLKLLLLLKGFREHPPATFLPLNIVFVSVARKLGYPVGLAYTPAGVMVSLEAPEQDCFLDINEEAPQWWTIEGEPPRPKPGVEQVGTKLGDKSNIKHWPILPRDIMSMALASRGDRLRGHLKEVKPNDSVTIATLDEGDKVITEQEWRDRNKQALVAYLQAQLSTNRIRYEPFIEHAFRSTWGGWRGEVQMLDTWFGNRIDPALPFDGKTLAGRVLPYEKLLEMKPEQLAKQDIGEVNLAVGDGLPSSEKIDVPAALKQMDEWAQLVAFQLKRNRGLWEDTPAQFGFSEAKYKTYILAMTLQEDAGIKYAPEIAQQYDEKTLKEKYPDVPYGPALIQFAMSKSKSKEKASYKFISGFFGSGEKIGTCTSMAVLYAAVGRRLGMPIKIVKTAGHVFTRWDDGKEKFNFEATNGFEFHDDEFYKSWPLKVYPQDIEEYGYLKSLTPSEELALFLKERSSVLDANGRVLEAMLAMAQANLIEPKQETTRSALYYLARRYFDRPRVAQTP